MSGRVPTYRRKRTKTGDYAVVTIPDGLGGRRDVLLGRYGTAESRAEYRRVLAEWEASGQRLPTGTLARDLSVAELIVAFLPYVEKRYRRADGSRTSEVADIKLSLRPLNHLYGRKPAREFGPLALKAVRELMVKGYDHPRYGRQPGLSRRVVNQRIGRIKRFFKWAAGNEMIPPALYHGLLAVEGLDRGRSDARETAPIRPVSIAAVETTIPYLLAPVAAMVRLQLATGMRPGEVCQMRACDLDMSGAIWLYAPAQHKTMHHGKERIVAIGPRGQAIIREFLALDTQAYLFSPRRAVEAKRATMRQQRKTKVQPSQVNRKKAKPKRQPSDRYTGPAYEHAIRRACDRAFPPPPPLARLADESIAEWQERLTPSQKAELKEWQKAHRWHPNQLRHTHATQVRREFGLEAAQVALGHAQANVTQIYAERNLELAAKVAQAIG